MNWQNDFRNVAIGVPVLVKLKDGQYVAGAFKRTPIGTEAVQFESSDGAWSLETRSILRFCTIED